MKTIKVEALLNGMYSNPVWEVKNKDADKIMKIYNSMPSGSYNTSRKDLNRLYNGCMLEVSGGKNIHVFDGYAIINENNVIEVRVDKNKKLENQLLMGLQTAPMIKNLIFNSDLSRTIDVQKAV